MLLAGILLLISFQAHAESESCNFNSKSASHIVIEDNPVCVARAKWYAEKISNAQPLVKLVEEIQSTNPQVIMLGENHYTKITTEYPTVLEFLKEKVPDLDCLVLELPSPRQPDIDKLVLEGASSKGIYNSVAASDRIILKASRIGMKVRAIDASWIVDPKLTLEQISEKARTKEGKNSRDNAMSENINTLLKNGTCKKIVALTGKAHVADPYVERKSLRDRLLENKLQVVSVNLQNTGNDNEFYGGKPDEAWYWSACKENPQAVSGPKMLYFKNDKLPQGLTMYSIGGDLKAFDYTLVIAP